MFTSNEEHGPAAEVFDCEDHISGIEQNGRFDGQFVLATIVDHLQPAVTDHQLAINSPGRLFDNVMGQKTVKSAVFPFQDSCGLQTLDNGYVQVWKSNRTTVMNAPSE